MHSPNQPILTVLSALSTTGIMVTVIFQEPQILSQSPICSRVFMLSSHVKVLISLFAYLYFLYVVCQYGKVHNSAGSLFLWTITKSVCLVEIMSSISISKLQRSLCVSSSWSKSGLYWYDSIQVFNDIFASFYFHSMILWNFRILSNCYVSHFLGKIPKFYQYLCHHGLFYNF